MVLTIVLTHSWVAITLTISTLCIITFFICCACWKQKRPSRTFYILDNESSLRTSNISEFAQNSLNNLKLFRRLSTSKDNKIEAIFTSNNLPFYKIGRSDSDLMDSADDTSKSFEKSKLQLEDGGLSCISKEEMLSCISSESQYTFYSTHPTLLRSNSRATFVSVDFDSDTEKLID